MELSVIMPALNEEKSIISVIDCTINAFRILNIDAELIVINDGSTDMTADLVNNIAKKNPSIKILNHLTPRGIGACFWDGVDNSSAGAVCLIPSDNEVEPSEILRYFKLMDDVDMVIPFVFNKEVRAKVRNTVSFIFKFIINSTFGTSLNYTNGTVIYRRSLLAELGKRNSGFFYQADILIRLVKKGFLFAEVPYSLRRREGGKSKAINLRSLKAVIKGYLSLVWDIYIRKEASQKEFNVNSLTYKRTQQ